MNNNLQFEKHIRILPQKETIITTLKKKRETCFCKWHFYLIYFVISVQKIHSTFEWKWSSTGMSYLTVIYNIINYTNFQILQNLSLCDARLLHSYLLHCLFAVSCVQTRWEEMITGKNIYSYKHYKWWNVEIPMLTTCKGNKSNIIWNLTRKISRPIQTNEIRLSQGFLKKCKMCIK